MNTKLSPNGAPPPTKTSPAWQAQLARLNFSGLLSWNNLALLAILLLAGFLHFYGLEKEGYANQYYAAAVRSMLTSWHNFFFVAFDPGGFVSVDKPPLGLWVQTASAWLFGFRGWSLLLPQALAGVLSVGLLYHLVARVFGAKAGLLAALVLALSPISTAANRNNTMDSLLVLTSLLAAWAGSKAAEGGRLRWLLACAVWLGVGFNIKMLQAYLILPAVFLIYLSAPLRWWKRLLHLALAGAVTAIISLSWAVIVDLTPAKERPYVGSSQNNTVMELVIGHNGAARLGVFAQWLGLQQTPGGRSIVRPTPANQPPNAQAPRSQTPPGNMLSDETGSAGPLRLFNRALAGQSSWLLVLAGLCVLPLAWRRKWSWPLHTQQQALLLWAAWLAPQVVFFSYAGLFHRYYLEMMAPAIAALVGAGIVRLVDDFAAGRRRGWLLPVALLGSAVVQAAILAPFPEWAQWLALLVGGLALASCTGLVLTNWQGRRAGAVRNIWAGRLSGLGMLALLIAPGVWASIPVLYGGDTGLPYAGPDLLQRPRINAANQAPSRQLLIDFLQANQGGETFILATISAQDASPIIVTTGRAVMALGGFTGSDPILSAEQLAAKVVGGEVRFFLLPTVSAWMPPGGIQPTDGAGQAPPGQIGPGAGQPPYGAGQMPYGAPLPPGGSPQPPAAANRPGQQIELIRWVAQHCRALPARLWGGPPPGVGQGMSLFDCR